MGIHEQEADVDESLEKTKCKTKVVINFDSNMGLSEYLVPLGLLKVAEFICALISFALMGNQVEDQPYDALDWQSFLLAMGVITWLFTIAFFFVQSNRWTKENEVSGSKYSVCCDAHPSWNPTTGCCFMVYQQNFGE